VVVERAEPFVTRTVKGEVYENHYKTVDVTRITVSADGQSVLDGSVVSMRGNEMVVTYDDNGVSVRYEATITEQYPGLSRAREASERTAQVDTGRDGRTGVEHDQASDQPYDGGHAGGHQFFPGMGRDNMFPQESTFNRQVYTQVESEMADWANAGARIRLEVEPQVTRNGSVESIRSYTVEVDGVETVVQQVPDRIVVDIQYTDASGNVVHQVGVEFDNAPGQSYQSQPPTPAQQAQLK